MAQGDCARRMWKSTVPTFSVLPSGEDLLIQNVRVAIPLSGLNAGSLSQLLTDLHTAGEVIPLRLSGERTYPDWWAGCAHGDLNPEAEEWKYGPPDAE
jgi:hypothetical protein